MNTLSEMLKLAGLEGAEDLAESDDLGEAVTRVKHTYHPRNKQLLATHPQDIVRAVLSPLKGSVMPNGEYSATAPMDAPNASQIRAAMEQRGHKGYYPVLALYALNPVTNKETSIATFKLGNKVEYWSGGFDRNEGSWRVGGRPSFEQPGKAKAEISILISKATKFLNDYIKAAKAAPKGPIGGDSISRALQINKDLGLNIPEAKLKKLFDMLGG